MNKKYIEGLTEEQKKLLDRGASFEITEKGKLKFIIPKKLQNELILEKKQKYIKKEKQKIEQEFQEAIKKIIAGYSQAEIDTWNTKVEEAKKVLAGETSNLLNSLLVEGETAEELAQNILNKAKQYSELYCKAERTKRQKLKKLEEKYK